MSMFSMFVESPPPTTPVNMVYFEKLSFGPFGEAANEPDKEAGFSEILWLQVAQNAAETYRKLRLVCNGTLRVLGPQQGFPANDLTAPHVVELIPAPVVVKELERLCAAAQIETPRRIIYHGLDLPSLTIVLEDYFSRLSSVRVLDQSTNRLVPFDFNVLIGRFMLGEMTVPIIEAGLGPSKPLGLVSEKNLERGLLKFGIEIHTGPPLVPSLPEPASKNYLDPVTLFSVLASGKLANGSDAIDPQQKKNSWLDNVHSRRVLITFRDEWNAPLLSPTHSAIVEGPSAGQKIVKRLDRLQAGTIEAPALWGTYKCSVGLPNQRKLTPIRSAQGAADPLIFEADGPAHRVVASVRPEEWFHPSDPPFTGMPGFDLSLYTEGNIVTPLIDGLPSFARLVADLRELDDSSPPTGRYPNNFVLLGGWYMDLDFQLIPGDPGSTVKELLRKGVASNHKLIVRGLVWWLNDNLATDTIRGLDGTPHYTEAWPVTFPPLNEIISFHWKCSVVRNRHGTFAQLGGIDINPNRLDDSQHKPGGKQYHDVQCRIQGPAAQDVTEAFLARWHIHGLGSEVTDAIKPTTTTPPDVPATHMVQIARTFCAGTGAGFQPWSPNGERTIWATLKRAISRARRYIYIEEQYLTAPMLRDALLAVLAKSDVKVDLVIVISDNCEDFRVIADQPGYDRARYLFLKDMINHPRVQVFSIKDYYLHTKVSIVDDVFATIGSANMNRRGLTHDAELNAFILDGRVEDGARKFARDLRTRLWAEHLGMPLTPASFTQLNDLDRALDMLRNKRPSTSHLIPYTLRNPGSDYTFQWQTIADPIGF